jgi:phosphate transport system substrate-binding protein
MHFPQTGLRIATLVVLALGSAHLALAEPALDSAHFSLDPNLPYYRPVKQLSGELKLGGSNTLSHIAAVWIDGFTQFYPDVKISIDVNGSRQAIQNVQTGSADIGLLSRTVHREEVEAFRTALGFNPTVLTPCMERTGIFVHKDNPVQGITLAQLDAIYSDQCRRGESQPCRTWGQLGLTGPWAKRPIVAHGRTKETGSQVFMQKSVMLGAPLRSDLQAHVSNVEMLQAVANDPNAIGFSGLSYATPEVKAVPLGFSDEEGFVAIDSPEADRGLYPLARRLQLVVKHDPAKELPLIQQEFIKYAFSRLGQEDVIKAGFQPIPARPAHVALDAVGLGVSR